MIRPAAMEDVPAILAIYAPYVENTTITFEYTVPTMEEFTQRFRDITAQFPWLVWEENGEILGYAYGSAPFTRMAYSWCAEPSIYLRTDVRGRGIGRKLYNALEQILAYQGYQVSYAIITSENEASLAFHRALGYTDVCEFPNCGFKHGRWLGTFWLEKRLKTVEIPMGLPASWLSIVQDEQSFLDILGVLSLS